MYSGCQIEGGKIMIEINIADQKLQKLLAAIDASREKAYNEGFQDGWNECVKIKIDKLLGIM